eukprot:Skav219687  [mRNA]  locus=scaffold817:114412:115754:- [translate_table: standard]
MPDTSPRGEGVPDEDPKAKTKHYRMLDYITQELPSMVAAKLPLLQHRLGIMGHSMGGHGALVAALHEGPDVCSLGDPFLSEQLKPGLLKAICDEKGLALTLRNQQEG